MRQAAKPVSNSAAQLMSSIVFAGSAQFITAQLFSENAPALVIVLTIAVVNLRHMLYSASLAPYLKNLSLKWKALLSYLLTDEAYAPSIIKYEKDGVQPLLLNKCLLGFGIFWITQTLTVLLNEMLMNYLSQIQLNTKRE